MSAITLTLPYPISANRYWRTFMPKGFKAPVTTISKEAKDYKAAVAMIARCAGIRKPITGRVAVSYVLYPQRPLDYIKRMRLDPMGWDDTVQCIDLDNAQNKQFVLRIIFDKENTFFTHGDSLLSDQRLE